MIKKNDYNKKGFTLVEFLLYISLFAIFFISLFSILHIFYNNQAKNNIRLEVEQQGQFISQIISQEIRNAQEIISPNNVSNQLSLLSFEASRSPLIISLVNEQIMYQEGVNQAINLSSQRVKISDMLFENVSVASVSAIRFSFTISLQDFSKDFFGVANLNLINL